MTSTSPTSVTRSDLKTRVITAALGAAILLSVLIWGEVGGASLFALVLSMGGAFEWGGMTLAQPDFRLKRATLLASIFVLVALGSIWPEGKLGLLVGLVLVQMFAALAFAWRRRAASSVSAELDQLVREQACSVFALVYLGLLPLYLPMIRAGSNGLGWTLLLFFSVWAADSGAYFAGRAWGRRKLFEIVSPKKTVEGFFGGMVLSLVISGLASGMLLPKEWFGVGVLAGGIAALVSQVGDLFESLFKRSFGTKDSGTIFPGHGGFLDRFDGVLVALPVFYFCLRFLGGLR